MSVTLVICWLTLFKCGYISQIAPLMQYHFRYLNLKDTALHLPFDVALLICWFFYWLPIWAIKGAQHDGLLLVVEDNIVKNISFFHNKGFIEQQRGLRYRLETGNYGNSDIKWTRLQHQKWHQSFVGAVVVCSLGNNRVIFKFIKLTAAPMRPLLMMKTLQVLMGTGREGRESLSAHLQMLERGYKCQAQKTTKTIPHCYISCCQTGLHPAVRCPAWP